jgi:hypothetical protein
MRLWTCAADHSDRIELLERRRNFDDVACRARHRTHNAMRTALLPSSGNPYTLELWLSSYHRFWKDEVDRLHVVVNVPIEAPVMKAVRARLAVAGATMVEVDDLRHPLQHGEGIARLLETCEDGLVLLIEEDCFVLRSGEIDRCFRLLESEQYDIVASPRPSCSQNIERRSRAVFGLTVPPHFSPNMFFASKRLLQETDGDFSSRNWRKGERIEPLDFVCTQDEAADTFVWTSIQLRGKGPRVLPIQQHHASPHDVEDFAARRGLFSQVPPWVHFGSLAGGTHVMMDQEGHIIAFRELRARGHLDDVRADTAAEHEKRLAMWMLCRTRFPIRDPGAAYYNDVFDFAAANLLERGRPHISSTRVAGFTAAYATLFSDLLA